MNVDDDFAGGCFWVEQVAEFQNVGSAKLVDVSCLHHSGLAVMNGH